MVDLTGTKGSPKAVLLVVIDHYIVLMMMVIMVMMMLMMMLMMMMTMRMRMRMPEAST
jgi:hypothetical protein